VKVTFHDDALAEYVDGVAWYERDYPGRGERFAAAVEKAIEAIAGQPDTSPTRLGVRAATVHRSRMWCSSHEAGKRLFVCSRLRMRSGGRSTGGGDDKQRGVPRLPGFPVYFFLLARDDEDSSPR
jgi:hypothetical protein